MCVLPRLVRPSRSLAESPRPQLCCCDRGSDREMTRRQGAAERQRSSSVRVGTSLPSGPRIVKPHPHRGGGVQQKRAPRWKITGSLSCCDWKSASLPPWPGCPLDTPPPLSPPRFSCPPLSGPPPLSSSRSLSRYCLCKDEAALELIGRSGSPAGGSSPRLHPTGALWGAWTHCNSAGWRTVGARRSVRRDDTHGRRRRQWRGARDDTRRALDGWAASWAAVTLGHHRRWLAPAPGRGTANASATWRRRR